MRSIVRTKHISKDTKDDLVKFQSSEGNNHVTQRTEYNFH